MEGGVSKVILIEDDFQLGDVVTAFLEMHKREVSLCETASDALEKIKNNQFECIILDLNLPDEDGLVLLRKIRNFNSCPVIICSARRSIEDMIAGFKFGAQDYLPKPYSAKELILRISNLISLTTNKRKEPITKERHLSFEQ